MPELPDITVYVEALEKRILHQPLLEARILNPFLLRTAVPPIGVVTGKRVVELRRIGKQIAIALETELWLVLHLMIAGRLHWREESGKAPRKPWLASFKFPTGELVLTEAGSKRRAALRLVQGEEELGKLNRGGLEVLDSGVEAFSKVLTSRNHTLKRALTDPTLFSGIGNAYSDEILHRAGFSPVAMTQRLVPEQISRLHDRVQVVLREWISRLRTEAGGNFPEHVTAFRAEMAVHGRFGKPCPVCGSAVQRIRYADNETNYCPRCQTNGKILADRSLSLLLKKDWPRTIDEWEQLQRDRGR
ncbi:MAG TPA: DNA-formamidopyrimidine glycosylase family protein [Verrucomicrobiae bacterium]|jgi:formamidopyrimidine-DNA glycosylase